MIKSWFLLLPVLLPVVAGVLVWLVPLFEKRKIRNVFTLVIMILNVLLLLPLIPGAAHTLHLFTLSDSLQIFLRNDAMGTVFAVIMCFVWAMAGAYSFEYMAHEDNNRRYYAFYLCTLGVLMALCFSGTIVTFYMFYEAMTLLTFPLVMHTMKKDAVAAGLKYLIYSVLGASLALLGVFILTPFVRDLSFMGAFNPNGTQLIAEKVAGHEGLILTTVFLMLIGFSTKAGMFPLHGWLPTAHPAAPSPASAVLSGVITKAGVLGVIRLVFCFVGTDFLRGTWVHTAYMSLTLFTVFMGSLLAFKEGLLKKRLAYSSVSQVSYILFGLSTLHPVGLIGALLHVACHSLVKDTLFMSAGAIILKTGHTRVDELNGIGRRMPVVMWCFTLASVCLVGIPPALGFVSKWYLAQGAMQMTGVAELFRYLAPAVLLISALLTAGYLFPISIRGFFPQRNADGSVPFFEKCEPSCVMLIPLCLLAALSILLGMFPTLLTDVFQRITTMLL